MSQWIKRWNITMARRPTMPGVWKRKEEGFVVRARVRDGKTGKQAEILKVLIDTTRPEEAYAWLQEEKRRVRTGQARETRSTPRFFDYAVSLLERKIVTNEIKSAKTKQRWGYMLEHHLKPAFGDFFVDKITRSDVEQWRARVGGAIHAGMSPHSANGILATLSVILNAAADEFALSPNPIKGVKPFPTTRPTYTPEEPNALTADELGPFLATMRRDYPQHFGMVLLGFVTGLRPSSMRPLRRSGPDADIHWDNGIIRARRSHTVGKQVMETTKTGIEYRIALPSSVIDVLRAHVAQLPLGPMAESVLLFPSETGGFRAPSCLDKPFAAVARTLGLEKTITPRAMRRTYQDLARQAQVNDVVTRAISGHATEAMQHHYSSVGDAEKREAVARIYSLVDRRLTLASGGQSGGQVDETKKAGGT